MGKSHVNLLFQPKIETVDFEPPFQFIFLTINVQNYFQLISSYKIPMQKEKTLTQILV